MLGRKALLSAICLIATWSAVANTALGEEPRVAPKASELPSSAKAVQLPADAEAQEVVIQMVIFEMAGSRNEIKTALAHGGLRESADGNRYVSAMGRVLNSNSEELSTVLRNLASQTRADVLSRPQIRTLMGQVAKLQISTGVGTIPYLVPTGPTTFELRQFKAETNLGLSISLTARAADSADRIEISPLKVSMTTLDGREAVRGVELDVGKPIVSTRTLETSVTLLNRDETSAVVLPGPSGKQVVMFLTARRVEKARPGRILPNPIPTY